MSFLLGLALLSSVGGTVADPAIGLWSNPKGSLTVRTRRCGEQLCATVVNASAGAKAKAAAAGLPTLVGAELFSDYRPAGAGDWAGTLYVPDRGKRVASRLKADDGRTMKVSGCLLGGLVCKTQTWVRMDGALARR